MQKIRTVIWDLDDTVWLYKKDTPKILCKKLNIAQEEKFEEEYYKTLGNLFTDLKDEIITHDKVKEYISKQMPILRLASITADEFLELFSEGKNIVADINHEAIEMMKYFKQKGIRNISITDWFEKEQKISLASFDAESYIEKIYGCDDTYFKNSVGKISQIVAELDLEGRREEFIMIGDSLSSDIFFAKKLDIKSVWYNPKGKKNATNNIPTLEVKSLLELKDIL